jgi:UV excision repair protein RAD23
VYDTQEAVDNIVAMGFVESDVRAALIAAQGDSNIAMEVMFNPGLLHQLQERNAQMEQAQQQQQQGSGAGAAAGGGTTLDTLRAHPQFSQLRRMVRENPASVNNVLELIGQQSPELLAAIHADQQGFMDMMTSDDEPAPLPTAPGAGMGMPGMPPMPGGGGNGAGQMQAVFGMINALPPDQQAAMLQQLGMTPEQWAATQQMLAQVPPAQLEQMMAQAGANMGGPGGMPGAPGGGGEAPPGTRTVQLTAEEMAAVQSLQELGFTQQQAAEAYLVCDKNVDAAAAYLFSQGDN